jgi:pimeloyl-ACP methyl ester carboxylesterase
VATQRYVEANGLRFRVLEDGEGPAVVLLHGFPDSADIWQGTLAVLANAGFRGIAPDLRGFGGSDKPAETEAYLAPNAVADVTGILDVLGIDRADLVGFDWGAAVAWFAATIAPDRLGKLVAVSLGHPSGFLAGGQEQLMRSWYVWLMQFRDVAEELFSRDDSRLLRQWLEWLSFPGDADAVVKRMSEPGALTAGMNWYRANVAPELIAAPQLEWPPITVPTLGIWGTKDECISERLMIESKELAKGGWRYERFEGSGHWPMLDQPERFNELLIEFLSG